MEELEAQRVITANAACQIIGGCDLCPLYEEQQDKTRQQGTCASYTSYDRVKEALTVLKRIH